MSINVDKRIILMSHMFYNKGVIVQESSQPVWQSNNNLGF